MHIIIKNYKLISTVAFAVLLLILATPVFGQRNLVDFERLNKKEVESVDKVVSQAFPKISQKLDLESVFERSDLEAKQQFNFNSNNSKKVSIPKNNILIEESDDDYQDKAHDTDDYEKRNRDNYLLKFPDELLKADPQNITPMRNSDQVLPTNNELVNFATSSIPNNAKKVSTTNPFKITFRTTPTKESISLLRFYPEAEFTTSLNGNTLTVDPVDLDRATEYVFGLRGYGICNSQNCSDKSEIWYYALRFTTNFYERKTIGYSHQGRELHAHMYGNAVGNGKSIMITGGTHGEEWHAGGLWMLRSELEKMENEFLNRNKEMVIIETVNVDGRARNEAFNDFSTAARFNARGVNLNRNFPASWVPCSICGAGPASENETKAVMSIALEEKVTHMIAYHNQWPPNGIIFLGDNSNPTTVDFANWVSARTGYPRGVYIGTETKNPSGDVGGDQLVWAESVNIRGILIEGTYRGLTDWDKNWPMYQALVREF